MSATHLIGPSNSAESSSAADVVRKAVPSEHGYSLGGKIQGDLQPRLACLLPIKAKTYDDPCVISDPPRITIDNWKFADQLKAASDCQ